MRSRLILIVLSFAGFFLYLGMTNISTQFNWGEGFEQRPIPAYLIIYLTLFLVYSLAVKTIWEEPADRALLGIILVGGLLLRAALILSQPIQEDDVYRYLWDGKVFAHGINPYEYSPKEVDDAERIINLEAFDPVYNERQIRELALLKNLKWQNESALTFKKRVNHPDVPTIYPPLMQYVFRLAYQIRPDSIITLRLLFLLFDFAAVVAVILILDNLGKNRNLCLVYFWSPLLIKETYNSTHLDVVGISMVCLAVFFLLRVRHFLATLFLAMGVLAKFYPAILFPLFLRTMIENNAPQIEENPQGPKTNKPWSYATIHCLLFLTVILAFYLPFLQTQWKTFAGLKTFTTYWQNNDSIFSLLVFFYGDLLGLKNLAESFFKEHKLLFSYNLPMLLSKVTVAILLAATLVQFALRGSGGRSRLTRIRQMFILMAMVFILSPAQYPWYFNWVLPFLCLFPSRALILLTGLLGLYYIDFYFTYQQLGQYNPWIPWVEYSPVYLLLAQEIWKEEKPSLFKIGK